MKRKPLLILFLIAFGAIAHASTNKYRLTLRDNPATSIVIGWNQVSGSDAVVYYGTADFGTDWTSYPNSKTVDRAVNYKGMNNRFARLTGLQPNTNYYFVIRDADGASSRFWFKTCSDDPSDRLSFIAGGDSRNNRTPRINANKLVAKLKPDAVLFGGDMTNGDSNSEWRTWFDDWQYTIANDGRMFPIVATRGNHEDANNSVYHLFDVPSSSVYYAITFGGSLVTTYTLNTEISISGTQTSWLASDLASNTATWKIAQYHKPMRPHVGSKSEGNSQYNNWSSLFYDHDVKLVIECDSHTVKTTWPVRPSNDGGSDEGFVIDDDNGTVYAGEGCWGAPLRTNNDNKTWTRNSGRFNQFKWIFVDRGRIEVRTIRVDNADQVGSVNNNSRFTAPANLDIWNPSNGPVVTITGDLNPPACSITAPVNNQHYETPQNITIHADAADTDGDVTSVSFFVNENLIDTDATSPYAANYVIPADGTYALTAVATDDDGLTTTTHAVNITVGVIAQVIDRRISSSMDDVEENGINGSMYTNSSDIELVNDGLRGNQTIGLRFTTIPIPQEAVINNAYLQFTTDETSSGTANLTIKGEAINDAPAFTTSANNVSNRTTTSAAVNWNPSAWNSVGVAGSNQRTPDIKSIIQEIINRPGWNSGNDMVMIITGTGERTAESYDGVSGSAPLLHIEYTAPGNGACSIVQVDFNDFETGYGIWNDGGSDCSRTSDTEFANSGNYSIRLRDNSSSSYTNTDRIDLSNFDDVTVHFSYICNSMDNSNEDFFLQISTDGGSSYTTVEEWNTGDEFQNNIRYEDAVSIPGPFTSNVRFRFVCDASSNGDQVYIDDIAISGCSTSNIALKRPKSLVTDDGSIGNLEPDDTDLGDLDHGSSLEDITIYTNPFRNGFTIDLSNIEITGTMRISIYDVTGKLMDENVFIQLGNSLEIKTEKLQKGIYILKIQMGENAVMKKIIKHE